MTTSSSAPPRGHILVVDDNDMVRNVVTRVLEAEGHTVEEASTAEDALARLSARPAAWTAVIMDLKMPGMSGLDALAVLRATWADLPVIIMSGLAQPPGPVDPAARFLDKPFTTDQLLEALADVMDGPGPAPR